MRGRSRLGDASKPPEFPRPDRLSLAIEDDLPRRDSMDIKTALLALTPVFVVLCLFFGTRNGFYDSDNYHGNGSAH